jgi:hypothetical protein
MFSKFSWRFFIAFSAGILLTISTKAGSGNMRESHMYRKILSTNGSTRATAYVSSNKIITKDGKIFVTWLDHVGKLNQIKVKSYDCESRKWSDSVIVGIGNDSHAGPALTMDKAGYIHIVYGSHHEPLKYSRTLSPLDISKWTKNEMFGAKDTYPSLITAPNGTLWCATRSSDTNPWCLRIYRRLPGKSWDTGIDVLQADELGYAQTGNSLAVGKDGTIHLSLAIYTQKAKACKFVGYMCSKDDGLTWENAAGRTMTIPVTSKSDCFVEKGNILNMRVSNIALDPNGIPWMGVSNYNRKPNTVVLKHYENNKWKSINLLPFLQAGMPHRNILLEATISIINLLPFVHIATIPHRNIAEATISFDRNGTLYVACSGGIGNKWWGSPEQEVIMLKSKDKGKSFEVIPISIFDSTKANWLGSIERPFSAQLLNNTPSVLYTSGFPGKGVKSKVKTSVVFVHFNTGKSN